MAHTQPWGIGNAAGRRGVRAVKNNSGWKGTSRASLGPSEIVALRAALAGQRVRREEFARSAGISIWHLSRILNEHVRPGEEVTPKIIAAARALGLRFGAAKVMRPTVAREAVRDAR